MYVSSDVGAQSRIQSTQVARATIISIVYTIYYYIIYLNPPPLPPPPFPPSFIVFGKRLTNRRDYTDKLNDALFVFDT